MTIKNYKKQKQKEYQQIERELSREVTEVLLNKFPFSENVKERTRQSLEVSNENRRI